MSALPSEVAIRSYDVGFGDCFLLSFKYSRRQRHVLIDFGSMSLPQGKIGTGPYMARVAKQIQADCGGVLDAVVATHRHRDHISGFAMTGKGRSARGPGAIIRALKPKLVVQPWTEDPRAQKDAEQATGAAGLERLLALKAKGIALRPAQATALYLHSLERMHEVAGHVAALADSFKGSAFAAIRQQLAVIGMDNIKNASAVENLRTMAPNRYVSYGSKSGLERILPGVKARILGPPTLKQTRTILRQRHADADEFWHLNASFWERQARVVRQVATGNPGSRRNQVLFPGHLRKRVPWAARWYRYYAMREHAESLLSIVRVLDDAMNNTSVILLLQVRNTLLLFPGDAQFENWMYALNQPGVVEILSKVNVYKVGHHGSLNATPKTLWNAFKKRGTADPSDRMVTFLSTKLGLHGHEESNTEVPRSTLVRVLHDETTLIDTREYTREELVRSQTIPLT